MLSGKQALEFLEMAIKGKSCPCGEMTDKYYIKYGESFCTKHCPLASHIDNIFSTIEVLCCGNLKKHKFKREIMAGIIRSLIVQRYLK